MKRHATSHGLAVIVCTITAGVLVKMAKDNYPLVLAKSENLVRDLFYRFGWNYPGRETLTLLLAAVLAGLWGVAFSFMHSDGDGD